MALPFFLCGGMKTAKRDPYLRQAGFIAALLRMTARKISAF